MTHAVVTWGDKQLLEVYHAILGLKSHYISRFHSNRASREEYQAFFGVLSRIISLLNYTARVGPLQKCHAKDPKSRFRTLDSAGIENADLAKQWQAIKNLVIKDEGSKDVNMLDLTEALMNAEKVPRLILSFHGPEGSRDFNIGDNRFLIRKLLIPLYNETLRWWKSYKSLI